MNKIMKMLFTLYRNFIEEKLGSKYTEGRAVEFAKSFEESGPATPIFFILSPGVDPLKDVEALGKKLNFSDECKNFHNISLGQGQEIVAEQAMDIAAKEGHWVVLQVSAIGILQFVSVVRTFAHGAMGRQIDPSWGGPIELFLVPASAPRLV